MAAVKDKLQSHFYIKVEGSLLRAEVLADLVSVEVESSLHLPDVATITLNDPALQWVDSAQFEPGKALRVEAPSANAVGTSGSGTSERLFDGEIVEMESEFASHTHRLIIRAFDRLHRLARGRQARVFQGMNDREITEQIAREVGLSAIVDPPQLVRHDYVMQAQQNNLDFLMGRAAATGCLLYVEEKTLYFTPLQAKKKSVEVRWNETLTDFRPRLSTIGQTEKVVVRGWNPQSKETVEGQASGRMQTQPKVGETRSGGEMTRSAFGISTELLVADRPVRSQSAADGLAKAVAEARAGRFVEAEGAGAGNPALSAGNSVRVLLVGERFSGDYVVTAARHIYLPEEGYSTEFQVTGLEAATLSALLSAGPSGGAEDFGATGRRRNGLGGSLVIGIVVDNTDPENLGRVKVRFPWLTQKHSSFWARLCTPGGGADRGLAFLPEVEDEVLVGFELGDMDCPYVLGGLWNGKDKPPKHGDLIKNGKVERRTIHSRTGNRIVVDDSSDQNGIVLQDSAGNYICLRSQEGNCEITVSGNVIIKANQNIALEAESNIIIKANQDVALMAEGNMALAAGGTISLTATAISLN